MPAEIPLQPFENANDKVTITKVKKDYLAANATELELKLAPNVTWHKKIRIFASSGFMGEIEVHDDLKISMLFAFVDHLARIELGVAAEFGFTHWDYQISDPKALLACGGHRVTFYWEKDAHPSRRK